MKALTFYEQVGILLPGAVLLAAIAALVPGANAYLRGEGLSLGDFGLFLLLSYAAGHAVAAVGNLFEWLVWKVRGGMPSEWVTHDPPKLLTDEQRDALQRRITALVGYDCPSLRGLSKQKWQPLFAQVYADVLASGAPRVETFNGNYGLNRGLASAMIGVVVIALVIKPPHLVAIAIGGAALAIVFAYRMYRFGLRFAREVYVTFLNSDRTPTRT